MTATVSATAATTISTATMNTERRKEMRERIRYVRRKTVDIPSDTEGSYTGMPMTNEQFSNPVPEPVQDADDL